MSTSISRCSLHDFRPFPKIAYRAASVVTSRSLRILFLSVVCLTTNIKLFLNKICSPWMAYGCPRVFLAGCIRCAPLATLYHGVMKLHSTKNKCSCVRREDNYYCCTVCCSTLVSATSNSIRTCSKGNVLFVDCNGVCCKYSHIKLQENKLVLKRWYRCYYKVQHYCAVSVRVRQTACVGAA